MQVDFLQALKIRPENLGTFSGEWEKSPLPIWLSSFSPVDNKEIAKVSTTKEEEYERVVLAASETFERWRNLPAPKRGQIIREIGENLRSAKSALGKLVSYETGKILAEGEGEIQEAIDIIDFAVGLSRQLYGKTMHSERPEHRMYEQWHPLGNIGVITAFNFPVAVWAWNAFIAAICGNTVIWKPSELAPLSALATIQICEHVTAKYGFPALFTLLNGDGTIGRKLSEDKRIPLVSATGSCRMGREVAEVVGKRLGRVLLELGGNNAVIVLADADLELAVRAILFGAVGTAGQRCTSTRRVYVERSLTQTLLRRLLAAYHHIKIGNPLDSGTLLGPLINEKSVETYLEAIAKAKHEGAEIIYGGERVKNQFSPFYVKPTIIRAHAGMSLLKEETFAPILYLVEIDSVEEGILLNNSVSQGLSSAIFTNDMRAIEKFLSASGSDCGIANVNIGTSGAEIGGAFGGEKDTGGGREAGSDAWQAYMRRQTNTINWGKELPLAQGVRFGES